MNGSDEINGLRPFQSISALNSSTPGSSATFIQPLNLAKEKAKQTASNRATPSASNIATAAKIHVAAKHGAQAATNETNSGSGNTGTLAGIAGCPTDVKRSRILRGRSFVVCLAPGELSPASALVPVSDSPSDSTSEPQSASSSEPQAAADTQQTDSEKTDSQKTDSQQTDSQQTDSQQTDSQQTDSQQTNSQPANDAPLIDSQPATPVISASPVDPPVVVQGQTVPANGNPITVDNQLVRVSSGSIYVGSSAAPIPQAQATKLLAEPIVAGTLTLHPASPSQVLQAAPSPAVVGGLTFSAAQSGPSVEANPASDQPQAQPVVVGGKTYAPISPNDKVQTSPGEVNTPNQGESEPSSSQEQSTNEALANSKPIVIGGMTYTPVAANPTPLSQSAAVFSFGGMALTQGGEAVAISGTRYSLGSSFLVAGTSSLPFSTPTATTSLLPIGSETLTALPGTAGGFEIGHSTLLPGFPAITVDGTTYSINKAGSLIAGTSTIALATAGSSNLSNSALTAGGETFTPLGSTAVLVDGTTLSIGGPAITEDGTKISLASNGLLVGSSTYAYATPVVNTAISTTASSTSSKAVLPGGGAASTTIASATGAATSTVIPSATGGVGKSVASGRMLRPRVIKIWVGISMGLSMMMRIV